MRTSMFMLCFVAVIAMHFGLGCGADTPCDTAADKVQQCGVQGFELNEAGEECKSISECQAECIQDATCGEIKDAVRLQENAMTKCINDCH